MPWRIAKVLAPERDAIYEIAMSLSYLMNCVATLANVGAAVIPNELLPATTILDETEMVPSELREIYYKGLNPDDKKYQRERRLRDLAHELKAGEGTSLDPLVTAAQVDVLPDEYI
jgi:hypothetical protein